MTAPNTSEQPPLTTPTPPSNPELDELRRQNAAILQQNAQITNTLQVLLQQNQQRSAPPAPAPIQIPEISREEFDANPTAAVARVVDTYGQRLAQDLNQQIAPVNSYILQQQKLGQVNGIVSQLKVSGRYPHLNNPAVEQYFVAALSSAHNVDQNVVDLAYNAAVGNAVSSGTFGQPALVNVPNNPTPPANQNIPAHLQPTSRTPQDSTLVSLPPLNENEARLAKERGWSHARACYMWDKITEEQYLKLEPQGRKKF